MALLWIEGFEAGFNLSDWGRKYDSPPANSINITGGRWGGSSARTAGSSADFRTRDLGNKNNGIIGLNFFQRDAISISETKLCALLDGTNEQIALYFLESASGQVQFRVKRGSTVIGTTTNFWQNGWWILVEWSVLLDTTGSNGSIEIKINGVSELLVTGIDTTNVASLVWNKAFFSIPNVGGLVLIDDIYVIDSSGAKNNTYIGEHAIEGFAPNGSGNRNQWATGPVLGGSPHSASVSESAVDDDASFLFVASQDDGEVELFAWTDATFLTDPIYGLFLEYDLRMDTGGSDHVRPKFRNGGGTEANGTTVTVSTVSTYFRFIEIFENDPTIAGTWTVSNWNAMQIGLESLA